MQAQDHKTRIPVKLPDNLRDQFKNPLGKLIPNENTLKENILKETENASLIITVGDATSEKMMSYNIMPDIQVVDGLEKRAKRNPPSSNKIKTELSCKNPPAQITAESIEAINSALTSEKPVRLLVDGEEDLLVIPICINAPKNSVILYGQPNEGLVVVRVDEATRNKTQSLLELMINGV